MGKKLRFNIDLTIVHKINLLVCIFFQILDNLQLTLDISNSEGGLKGYIQYDQKRDSESSRYGIGISIGFTLKGPMKRVRHSQCHSTYYWVFEIWRANCTYLSVIRRRSSNRSILYVALWIIFVVSFSTSTQEIWSSNQERWDWDEIVEHWYLALFLCFCLKFESSFCLNLINFSSECAQASLNRKLRYTILDFLSMTPSYKFHSTRLINLISFSGVLKVVLFLPKLLYKSCLNAMKILYGTLFYFAIAYTF